MLVYLKKSNAMQYKACIYIEFLMELTKEKRPCLDTERYGRGWVSYTTPPPPHPTVNSRNFIYYAIIHLIVKYIFLYSCY